jgi:hypothetical protein
MSDTTNAPQARNLHFIRLTRRQKNELIDTLIRSGVNVAQCELCLTDDGVRIFHKPTGSLATLSEDARGRYRGSLVIPDGPETEICDPDWKQALSQVGDWAAEVQYMTTAPDLWKQFTRQPEVPVGLERSEVDNAPFTPAEQAEISERLEQVQQYLKDTCSLSKQQMVDIEQRLDTVKEASERVGRKDWLMMLYGATFGMIVNDLMPPSIVQDLLTMTIHGITHIFGLGGLPPSIPPQ